jgi:hypothetical protein
MPLQGQEIETIARDASPTRISIPLSLGGRCLCRRVEPLPARALESYRSPQHFPSESHALVRESSRYF